MLIDYGADPSLADARGQKPIEKLHSFYNSMLVEATARQAEAWEE
jgi:hypothetical protein